MPQFHRCERARSWASLRADGELSELESALLDAHLGRCSSCRAFVRGTEEIAATLRAARLERPAPFVLRPQQQARRTGLRALQVVAAVAVVVGAGVLAAVTGASNSRPAAAKPVAMVAGAESPDRLRELRRPALVEQGRTIPRNKQLPGDAV
jgi:ferric-dicitrate binding protein FerR (iron transport regulator)